MITGTERSGRRIASLAVWKIRMAVAAMVLTMFAVVTAKAVMDLPSPPKPDPVRVRAVEGNWQSGFYGQELAPMVVELLDPDGKPESGIEVEFAIVTGPGNGTGQGVLAASSAVTGPDGRARSSLTCPEVSGAVIVEAGRKDKKVFPVRFSASCFHPADSTHVPISILSFNDFHTHVAPWGDKVRPHGGAARLATVLKTIRRNNDAQGIGAVVFNAGDDYENTLSHNVPGALTRTFVMWDRAGVDLYQVGNHDIHFGIGDLVNNFEPAMKEFEPGTKGHPMFVTLGNADPVSYKEPFKKFAPFFETNFNNADNSAFFNQTVVIDVNGIKVGAYGAVTDAAVYTQVAGDPPFFKTAKASNPYAEGLTFFEPDPRGSDYVNDAIDDLDGLGSNLIIGVSHTGLGLVDRANLPRGKDDVMALYGQGKECGRGIDFIISGHTHTQINYALSLTNPTGRDTYMIQADEGGRFVARMDVEVNPEDDSFTLIDSRLIPITWDLVPDPEIKAMADEVLRWTDEKYDNPAQQVVGVTDEFMSHRVEAESGMGNLIVDATLWKFQELGMDVDIAIAVPSIYRADLYPGPITFDDVYQILSMHKMVDRSDVDDTLAIVTMAPGLYNVSVFGVPETSKRNIGALEYVLEAFFSLSDVITKIAPNAADELNVDFITMGNVEFVFDATAKPFSRIVPGSLKIGGQPYDPDKTYHFSMMHLMASTLGKVMNNMFTVIDVSTGKKATLALLPEGSDEPYLDTGIPMWVALKDYLEVHYSGELERAISAEDIAVTGDRFRTVGPDLSLNSADIVLSGTEVRPGEQLQIMATIRNMGLTAVDSAVVEFYYDSTPWWVADDPDGLSKWQGLGDDFMGSYIKIGQAETAVGAYPATAQVKADWTVPDLYAGKYRIALRITDVVVNLEDPNTKQPYVETNTYNNFGPTQSRMIEVVR